MVSKDFEKLVNNSFVDHLEKCGHFSIINGFRSSQSTFDLITVLSDSIARVFNRSVANQAVALGIFKTFSNIWYGRLLHKLKSFGSDIWPYFVFSQ